MSFTKASHFSKLDLSYSKKQHGGLHQEGGKPVKMTLGQKVAAPSSLSPTRSCIVTNELGNGHHAFDRIRELRATIPKASVFFSSWLCKLLSSWHDVFHNLSHSVWPPSIGPLIHHEEAQCYHSEPTAGCPLAIVSTILTVHFFCFVKCAFAQPVDVTNIRKGTLRGLLFVNSTKAKLEL